MKNTVNSGSDLPKVCDMTYTAVQLESESCAEDLACQAEAATLEALSLLGLTAQPQRCGASPPSACSSQACTALLQGTTGLSCKLLD